MNGLIDMDLMPAPDFLIDLLVDKRRSPNARDIVRETDAGFLKAGSRNSSLTSLAGSMRRKDIPHAIIEQALLAVNAGSDEPLDEAEVTRISASIQRYDAPPDLSEQGVSQILASMANDRLRFGPTGWLIYDGKRWINDKRGSRIQEAIKNLLDELVDYIDANRTFGNEERDTLRKSALRLRRKTAIAGIAQLASSAPDVLDDDDSDEPPMMLNFQNGTLKLPSLALEPHSPADRLTQILPYEYDPEAECPTFDRILADVLEPDVADFLVRMVGYSLKGTGELQKMAILVGAGRNGKTTVVEAMANAMGQYAVSADPNSFMKSQFKGSINNDIARLAHARLIRTAEINTGQVLDASLIKRMTGEDEIIARFLHQDYFSFRVKALLMMVANFLPVFDGSDLAVARRLLVIKFNRVIDADKVDSDLPAKLAGEAPGIMNRLLQGMQRYEQDRKWVPQAVLDETDKVVRDGNQVGQFIDEFCEQVPGAKARANDVFDRYKFWCATEGSNAMTVHSFRAALQRTLSIDQSRDGQGKYWPNLQLKA